MVLSETTRDYELYYLYGWGINEVYQYVPVCIWHHHFLNDEVFPHMLSSDLPSQFHSILPGAGDHTAEKSRMTCIYLPRTHTNDT